MNVTTRGFLLLLFPVASAATPASALAQGAGDEQLVPLEFVQVISSALSFGQRGGPQVQVGRLADGVARLVPVPADLRVVGTLAYPEYSISAIAAPAPSTTLRPEWTERLLAAGWTRFQMPSRGGFESTPFESMQFCMGDSVTLNLGITQNPRGGSYVLLNLATARQYSPCRQPERPPMGMQESPIPSLSSPPGSATRGGGSGGGSDEWNARTRLSTDLPVDEVLEHYAAQLRAHGWVPIARTTAVGIAVETYRVTDERGAQWHAVLSATAPFGSEDQFLSLQLNRTERTR